MVCSLRSMGALVVACTLAWGLPASAAQPVKKAKSDITERVIAIAINGQEIARDPGPRVVGGRLLVPVVRIYDALGITVRRDGDDIAAAVPGGKTITLHIGSDHAQVGDVDVHMQGPALEIDGATYVPLRFVADSLGAQVTYDPKAARVDVISSVIGRTPQLTQNANDGATQVVGTVSAVDLNSEPESVTVTRGGSVRTIAITSDAKIVVQDVVTRTNADATLTDIHPGDAVSVYIEKDGRVQTLVDRYASRVGMVAAVSPSAVALQNGYVITPDRGTTITLNGATAALGDIHVGDSVTVRSNPDTGEKREILVSRIIPATPQATGQAAITSFTVASKAALRAGDFFDVSLVGTPGGKATFDIDDYVTGLPMNETTPGTYTSRYTVPAGVNFGETPIYGHLSANGSTAPRAQAPTLIAVSTTPPQITDIAPSSGQNINNNQPSIFATFTSPTGIEINPSSVTINVNGLDVTASSTRESTFITYSPSVALAEGLVTVRVAVYDIAGNKAERTWTFFIHSH